MEIEIGLGYAVWNITASVNNTHSGVGNWKARSSSSLKGSSTKSWCSPSSISTRHDINETWAVSVVYGPTSMLP